MRLLVHIRLVLLVAAIAPLACRPAEQPPKVPEDVGRPSAATVPAARPVAAQNAVDPVRTAWDFVVAKKFDRFLDRASGRVQSEDAGSWLVVFDNPESKAGGEQPYAHLFRVDKKSLAVTKLPID